MSAFVCFCGAPATYRVRDLPPERAVLLCEWGARAYGTAFVERIPEVGQAARATANARRRAARATREALAR